MSNTDITTTGVWALCGLAGGTQVIVRFKLDKRVVVESTIVQEDWILVDRAFTLVLVPAVIEGRPSMAPVCMPYGMATDDEQLVSLSTRNMVSVFMFEDMGKNTQTTMRDHVKRALASIQAMRAASSGIALR